MSRRKLTVDDLTPQSERRKAHVQGYEDGIWARFPDPPGPDDDPRALAYLIGYSRGQKARTEIAVQVTRTPERKDEEEG